MDNGIHVGDIGVTFRPTVKATNPDGTTSPVNISGASTLEITFKRPDGTTFVKTAVLDSDGSDGKMRYVTIANDMNLDGVTWQLQGRVVLPGGAVYHTSKYKFKVFKNLGG